MSANDKNQTEWQTNLADFFGDIEREDRVFSKNVERKTRFYAEVARPALNQIEQQLLRYGRECETGLDHDRVYIIVKKAAGNVEFQYAIVAEAQIETVTPFAHCWFETELPEENQTAQKSAATDSEESDDEDADDETDDKTDDEQDGGDGESKDQTDDKKKEKPKRTKTIELLDGWNDEREIETVSQTEIIHDFLRHYKEAVSRLRAGLHAPEV